jgi:hypothetical protein
MRKDPFSIPITGGGPGVLGITASESSQFGRTSGHRLLSVGFTDPRRKGLSIPTRRATPRLMAAPKDTDIEHSIVDPEKVPGNASPELKREVVRLWPFGQVNSDHFASSIGARLELVEVSVVPKREDAQVMEARIVAEVDVVPGMKLEFRNDTRLLDAILLTNIYAHQGCST